MLDSLSGGISIKMSVVRKYGETFYDGDRQSDKD